LRLIAHLSDLHFGRVDSTVLPVLRATLAAMSPHLVVVSGDLTQRARRSEFRDARQFLASLPFSQLVVPGNHDVPLYNVLARWLSPLTRYREHISADLEPFFFDDEIAVLGINTARANTFNRGRVNARQIEKSCERLDACAPAVTRIVVTHHPFDLPERADEASLVGRARLAIAGFARSHVDLILSGHLHGSSAGDGAARYGASGSSVLLVQAGTATSTRRRGEVNSFNLLRVDGAQIGVDCMAWDEKRQTFALSLSRRFRRVARSWSLLPADEPSVSM
jgi:3',5'-cyclic AMP phosphodiesterase CpdA